MQNGFVPMRSADVTADDTLLDPTGTTTTAWLSDFTDKDVFELGPECNACEIAFVAEADDTDYFQCNLWGGARMGNQAIGVLLCCVTGQAGAAIGDITHADSTARLFIDTITIDSQSHSKTISAIDSGNNRMARLAFDTVGIRYLYPEFEDVGDATECDRINAYIRTF